MWRNDRARTVLLFLAVVFRTIVVSSFVQFRHKSNYRSRQRQSLTTSSRQPNRQLHVKKQLFDNPPYSQLVWRLPDDADGDFISNLLIEMGAISAEIVPASETEWITITDDIEFMKTGRVKTSGSLREGVFVSFLVPHENDPEMLVRSVVGIVDNDGLDEDEAWASCEEVPIKEEVNSASLIPASIVEDAIVSVGGQQIHLDLSGDWAFGDGKHSSTRVSLKGLESIVVKMQKDKGEEGWSLLDYGCGSGILTLAGLALGANPITAIDIADEAINATLRNLQLNEHSLITPSNNTTTAATKKNVYVTKNFHKSNITEYDIVIANIPSNTLVCLLPTLASAMGTTNSSYLILAGYPATECDFITNRTRQLGLIELYDSRLYENGWILQTFVKDK